VSTRAGESLLCRYRHTWVVLVTLKDRFKQQDLRRTARVNTANPHGCNEGGARFKMAGNGPTASWWVESAPRSTVALTESARAADYAAIPILPSPADMLTPTKAPRPQNGRPTVRIRAQFGSGRPLARGRRQSDGPRQARPPLPTEIHDPLLYRRLFRSRIKIELP
jgi:hypothetical protein